MSAASTFFEWIISTAGAHPRSLGVVLAVLSLLPLLRSALVKALVWVRLLTWDALHDTLAFSTALIAGIGTFVGCLRSPEFISFMFSFMSSSGVEPSPFETLALVAFVSALAGGLAALPFMALPVMVQHAVIGRMLDAISGRNTASIERALRHRVTRSITFVPHWSALLLLLAYIASSPPPSVLITSYPLPSSLVLAAILVGGYLVWRRARVWWLVSLLSHRDPDVRADATDALGRGHAFDRLAIPALIDALGDASESGSPPRGLDAFEERKRELKRVESARSAAREALLRMGDSAAVELNQVLASPNGIRAQALEILLATIRGSSDVALLTDFLTASASHVRAAACDALNELRIISDDLIVRRYTADLRDASEDVRAAAAEALGEGRVAADGAISALIEALGDRKSDVRMASSEALQKLGALTGDLRVKHLLADLADSDWSVRTPAFDALEHRGLLTDEDEDRHVP